MSKKIIAFAATSSSRSINKQLVTYACGLLRGETEIEILDLNDYELPLFSVDREDELGQPPLAQAFLQKISDSDGIIIGFAEHNGCYTVAYKNLYDWVSRIQPKVYQDKAMVLLSASPGGRGGKSVMELALAQIPRFGGDVRASVSVPFFQDNFDSNTGAASNAEIAAQVDSAVNRLFEE